VADPTWPTFEALLRRVSGLGRAMQPGDSLRDDLYLDSFRLLELAVAIHETYGVDLGLLANSGEVFDSVGDIARHVGASW